MAIALVGSPGAISEVTAATVSPSFGQATTAGNMLVAVVGANVSADNITTTASGWSRAEGFGTIAPSVALWYKANCGAGETAPTFTSSGATAMGAVLAEFSGVKTSSPVDQVGNAQGVAASSIAASVSCSGADTNTSDLAIAGYFMDGSKSQTIAESAQSWTPASGSSGTIGDDTGTKQTFHLRASYYLLNGHGGGANDDTENITFTSSTGTTTINAVIASFLPAAPLTQVASALTPSATIAAANAEHVALACAIT